MLSKSVEARAGVRAPAQGEQGLDDDDLALLGQLAAGELRAVLLPQRERLRRVPTLQRSRGAIEELALTAERAPPRARVVRGHVARRRVVVSGRRCVSARARQRLVVGDLGRRRRRDRGGDLGR